MSGSHCLWILIDQFDITRHSKRRRPPLQSDCPFMALVSHNLHIIAKAIKIWMAWSKDCMLKKICHLLIYIDKTTAIIEQEGEFWKENDFLCHMAKTFLGYLGFCLSSGAWAEMYKSWLNERDKFPRGYFIHWQLLTPNTGPPIYLGTKKHEL